MPASTDANAQAQRRDHPILFSAPMIRALLDGRKTETRRVLKPQPTMHEAGDCTYHGHRGPTDYLMRDIAPRFWTKHQPGDLLWVRETISTEGLAESECHYRATIRGDSDYTPEEIAEIRWRSPIHMPRWASRITLLVREVRVERLQEITERGARAEGTQEPSLRLLGGESTHAGWSERQVFSRLWNHLHARDGYGWCVNPWVAVIRFDVIRENIDSPEVRRRVGQPGDTDA